MGEDTYVGALRAPRAGSPDCVFAFVFESRKNPSTVSRLPSPVSRLASPVSHLMSPISRLLPSPISRLPSPVSRLPSPVSRDQKMTSHLYSDTITTLAAAVMQFVENQTLSSKTFLTNNLLDVQKHIKDHLRNTS